MDANDVVAFSAVPSGSLRLTASADGLVASTVRLEEAGTSEIVLNAAEK